MYYLLDHVRLMLDKTTLFFLLLCFSCVFSQAQELEGSLQNGASSAYKELHVGTIDVPGVEISGIGARFTGDFRAYPPDSMEIQFTGCWFTPGVGDYDYSWTFASDSSWADLQIWDTNANTYSGYGKFLQFYKDGGIGSLDLDDLLKTGAGMTVESVWLIKAPKKDWTAYPNPLPAGSDLFLDGLAPGSTIEVMTLDGRTVLQAQASPGMPLRTDLQPGAYLLLCRNLDGQVLGSRKLMVQ